MIILLSSDDGINPKAHRTEKASLNSAISTPWRRTGRKLHEPRPTLHRPLRVHELGPRRLSVDGTP
jgi:hypothetical protein